MTNNLNINEEYYEILKKTQEKYGYRSIAIIMVGGFYEMYTGDNENSIVAKVANLLELRITKKSSSEDFHLIKNPYMCGVPLNAIGKYLTKLLKYNFTISVYDQFDSDSIATKRKIRRLVKVLSPGTDIEYCEANSSVLGIYIDSFYCPLNCVKKTNLYFTHIDLATGKCSLNYIFDNSFFDCNFCFETEVRRYIDIVNPNEIVIIGGTLDFLIGGYSMQKSVQHVPLDKNFASRNFVDKFLQKTYPQNPQNSNFDSFSIESLTCLAVVLQFIYEHDMSIISKIQTPAKDFNNASYAYLNYDAIKQLNLYDDFCSAQKENFYFNHSEKDVVPVSSLFNLISKGVSTKMGLRLLKSQLINLEFNPQVLKERYKNIKLISPRENELKKILTPISDLESKYRKFILNKLPPIQWGLLNKTFESIGKLLKFVKSIPEADFGINEEMEQNFHKFYDEYLKTFNLEALNNCENINKINESFLNKGVNPLLDKLSYKVKSIENVFENVTRDINKFIAENCAKARATVRLCSGSKDGYFLETTKRCWESFSGTEWSFKFMYMQKNLKISGDMFRVKPGGGKGHIQLKCDLFDKLENVKIQSIEKMGEISQEFMCHYSSQVSENYDKFFTCLCQSISRIDIAVAGNHLGTKWKYTFPVVADGESSNVKINGMRHPLIERIDPSNEYIPNDITLDNENNVGILLYGLNSTGKSSLLRALGSNIVLAQAGFPVACDYFEFVPYTKIFAKISSQDNLFKGQSTFISEMLILRNILDQVDGRTLVLCDELTAGTEIDSSIGIVASAILKLISNNSNFIFTTHLHGLMEFDNLSKNPKLKVKHFNIDMQNCERNSLPKFSRKLKDGSGNTNYGIEIANSLGMDSSFIKTALDFRARFKGETMDILSRKKSKYNSKIIIDQCTICSSKGDLHVHHINHVEHSDENGMIQGKSFHKNIEHNLMVLCKKCHMDVHANSNERI